MEMRLEVVPVPVSDVDRAKAFYADQLGFVVDHDTSLSDTMRFIQLTPPGSACSIVVGKGMPEISDMVPGSVKQLHLVVPDVAEIKELLGGRGVEVSDITEYPRGIKFAYFSDPDGNTWALQEIPPDLHER
jgi:catechol 2,3-dioxygenase-like lactoylglutathione lyase family enzyme